MSADSILEEIRAERLAWRAREQQARDDAENTVARAALAAVDAEEATQRPALEAEVQARQAEERAAHQAAFAAAATCEMTMNKWHHRRMHWYGVAARTLAAPAREELARLEAALTEERARLIATPGAEAPHAAHCNGLHDAIGLVQELGIMDPAEIPARLAAIRATIPPRSDGTAPAGKSWVERQGERIQAHLRSKFTNPTTA